MNDSLAVVFGATGGIGGALARGFAALGLYGEVIGVGRRRPDDWPDAMTFVVADVTDEKQISDAAGVIERRGAPSRVVVATGLLHKDGIAPERTMRSIDPGALAELFAVNAIAPALIAKHVMPIMPRDRAGVFAALSARVGSISDNRLGGWYGYRASKAALNMLVATLAIEHRRTHPMGICVALHPGTVDTRLSAPFGSAATAKRLSPDAASAALIGVMDRLRPEDTGGFFAGDGRAIPW